MSIQVSRIAEDVARIAAFTQTPGKGRSCPTFSREWRQACDYVTGEVAKLGGKWRIDAAGNVHCRPAGLDWDSPAWLSGSHLDSVPHGGDFDGVAGVVVPLEVMRSAHERGKTLPLELIVFAEEEGTTFGMGMLGSHALTGRFSAADFAKFKNAAGEDYLRAGEPYGVLPEAIAPQTAWLKSLIGMIEVHIEQGPRMWRQDQPIALVEAIAGRRQYECVLRGQSNHAGTTPMCERRDCVVAAAEIIVALNSLAAELGPQVVITVGKFACRPGAVNVVAGEATFSVDFRAPTDDLLLQGDAKIAATIDRLATTRSVSWELTVLENLPAIALDAGVLAKMELAANRLGVCSLPRTVSGALHDAAILAPHVPTAMLFVPSRDGISHDPLEFSRLEDLALAAAILQETVTNS